MAYSFDKNGNRVEDHEVVDFLLNIFSEPGRWIKNHPAKDAYGRACSAHNVNAACFCFTGGIDRYAVTTEQNRRIRRLVQKHLPARFSSIEGFNDYSKTCVNDVKTVLKAVGTDLKFV